MEEVRKSMSELRNQALLAKDASYQLALAGASQKNEALLRIAENLLIKKAYILSENEKDIVQAEANGIRPTMIDRLRLTEKRI